MSYTKLANSILTSTIWMEPDHTRLVWLTLLAMADRNGEVQASIPGLANVARVPVESCRAAIQCFLSPDPDSRTKDDEGRRVEEIQGGWLILNHAEYRNLSSDDDRREKAAIRQQRFRDRQKRNEIVTPECDTGVICDPSFHTQRQKQIQSTVPRSVVAEAKAPRPKRQGLTDEWLVEIKPTYPDIDVQTECQKMILWCSVKGKQPSRSRLISWLNRIEKPSTVQTNASHNPTRKRSDPANLPGRYKNPVWPQPASNG